MSYKFSLRIDRDGHTMAEAMVSVESTTQEIAKGKRTITRLMNEYARAVTLLSAPEEPVLQGPITPTNPAEPEIAQDPPSKGASGLLRLYCPECSCLFNTFLLHEQSEFLCKCGHSIDLTAKLAPYQFVCPSCKKRTWGKTNLEDQELVIPCRCGKEIELDWVPVAKNYQLIRRRQNE